MGATIKGEQKMMRELESRLGKRAMATKVDRALEAGAKVFEKELREQLETFKDTGATIEELTFTKPRDVGGVRTITAHWKGPKNRYRIIHLNEFGTVKNPNPRGKGAIARALRNAEKAYRAVIKRELSNL